MEGGEGNVFERSADNQTLIDERLRRNSFARTHRVYVFQVQLYLVPRFVERLSSFQMVFGRDFVQTGQQQRILGHALNWHLRARTNNKIILKKNKYCFE